MGFEQLAALKTQLAEKARQEKLAKQGGGGKGRGPRPSNAPAAKADASTNAAESSAGKQGAGVPTAGVPAAGHSGAGKRTDGRPTGGKPGGGKPAPRKQPVERTARADRPERKDRQDRGARASREAAAPTDPVLLLIRKLQNRFAATFPKKPAPKVPLKIGVFEDLMTHASELGADEAQLRAAIKTWCGGSRYWACMVEGAARIDLAGQPAGVVTAADAQRARRLENHREKRAQQRANPTGPQQSAAAEQAVAGAVPDVSASVAIDASETATAAHTGADASAISTDTDSHDAQSQATQTEPVSGNP